MPAPGARARSVFSPHLFSVGGVGEFGAQGDSKRIRDIDNTSYDRLEEDGQRQKQFCSIDYSICVDFK